MALLGDVEVPVAVSTLASGRTTRVHRTADTPTVDVPCAEGYLDFLAGHGIVIDSFRRREQMVTAAQHLVAGVGGAVDVEGEAPLLEEITDLVEQPTPVLGRFAERYLQLPAEILTTVMRKHQRYLSVRDLVRAVALPGTTGTSLVALAGQGQDVLVRAAELAKFDLASLRRVVPGKA